MKRSKSWLSLGIALACAAFTLSLAVCAQAQTYTDLANFDGQNGGAPGGPVTQATDGNFYGVTGEGGAAEGGSGGNVFRVTPTGTITSIYRFCSLPNCADGSDPSVAPILGSDGNLYGVTGHGGSTDYGIVYKMTLDGKITTLYSFCPTTACADGSGVTGLMQASDGNFYGTAFRGGNSNDGTIFRISPTGKFKVLYSFCSLANCADGASPQYPPIQGRDGNLYGTALGGGTRQGGVFYKLTPGGAYKVLYNFCIYSDQTCSASGSSPTTIVQDAHGNFFGTATYGGSKGNGAAFEITSTNQYIVLDSFDYLRGGPIRGLALANDGNLYGKTMGANGQNFGTFFEITPTGRYTELYAYNGCSPSGYYSFWGPLVQGTDGLFYGTTQYGGNGTSGGCGGYGTIFSLSNNLSPFVETVPATGKAGKSVIILGYGLSGTTGVTFNGIQAAFTVESDTYIKAMVPTGATSGTVSVVTPSGTLNSNPQFVVTK